jgi:hypothetical protein
MSSYFFLQQTGGSFTAASSGTIVLFLGLIGLETMNINKQCFSGLQLAMSLVIGSVGGLLWSMFVYKQGSPDLSFFSMSTDVCHIKNTQKYQCTKS